MDPGARCRLHGDRALLWSHGDLYVRPQEWRLQAWTARETRPRGAAEGPTVVAEPEAGLSRPAPDSAEAMTAWDAAALTGGRVPCPKLGR